MNLNFDEATMRQIVSTVLLDQLFTEEKKNQLIQDAVADLLKEKEVRDGYSTRKVSIITEAFERAALFAAQDIIQEEVRASPEFRAAVREIFKKSIDSLLTDEKLIESTGKIIGNILVDALMNFNR